MKKRTILSLLLFSTMSFFTLLLMWKAIDIKSLIITSTKFSYNDNQAVHPVYLEPDYYVFLPSHWDTDNINIQNDIPYNIEGLRLSTGTVSIETDKEYKIPGRNNLIFKKMDLPTIYINTSSSSLKKVNKDKKNKESAEFILIDENGEKLIEKTIKIKGRGNASWNENKKPYNITFEDTTNLLSLNPSSQFCLIANNVDGSHIRNALAFNISNLFGLAYTPKYEYANVYFNGSYNGLYMVCNKVGISESNVNVFNLDLENNQNNKYIKTPIIKNEDNFKYVSNYNEPNDFTGGYLLELFMEANARYDEQKTGFVCSNGQAVGIKSPENATYNEVKYISDLYQDFTDALLSENGYNEKGIYYTDYINVESFVNYYLVSELLIPNDANEYSVFLYKNSDSIDSKIYAGPIWDYDNSLGNARTKPNLTFYPNVIYTASYIEGINNKGLFYYLMKHEDFKQSVIERWVEAKELVNMYLENNYGLLIDKIYDDAFWDNNYWLSDIFLGRYHKEIIQFIYDREDFLDYYFLSNEEKVSISVITNRFNYCVPTFYINKGSEFEMPYFDIESFPDFKGWYWTDTDTEYNGAEQIFENRVIEARYMEQ